MAQQRSRDVRTPFVLQARVRVELLRRRREMLLAERPPDRVLDRVEAGGGLEVWPT